MKKVVHYDPSKGLVIEGSQGAILWPVNHPDSEHVSNEKYVRTSPVVSYDPDTGILETENTVYKPIKS